MLTKKQKLEAYKYCLDYVKKMQLKKGFPFMCNILEEWLEDNLDIYQEDLSKIFPEWYKYKPDEEIAWYINPKGEIKSTIWFEQFDYQSRIKLLKKVIKDTKNEN
jgi:hypothetical protein